MVLCKGKGERLSDKGVAKMKELWNITTYAGNGLIIILLVISIVLAIINGKNTWKI